MKSKTDIINFNLTDASINFESGLDDDVGSDTVANEVWNVSNGVDQAEVSAGHNTDARSDFVALTHNPELRRSKRQAAYQNPRWASFVTALLTVDDKRSLP